MATTSVSLEVKFLVSLETLVSGVLIILPLGIRTPWRPVAMLKEKPSKERFLNG